MADRFCRTCNVPRRMMRDGSCWACRQLPTAQPGDPCRPCGGRGWIPPRYEEDGPFGCTKCGGSGLIPASSTPTHPAAPIPMVDAGRAEWDRRRGL